MTHLSEIEENLEKISSCLLNKISKTLAIMIAKWVSEN